MSVSMIIEIFQDILDVKKGTVSLKTASSDIDQWDSVATVNIIVALEAVSYTHLTLPTKRIV